MRCFRVWLELANWPPGTPEYLDYRANEHHTGPDGALYLTWQEQRAAGLDLRAGGRGIVIEGHHVATLRGGAYPLWRWVDTVELADDVLHFEEPGAGEPEAPKAGLPPASEWPVEPPWHERHQALE